MKKITLLLGLSLMVLAPVHSELPAQFKFDAAPTKVTAKNLVAALKKLMKDCPELVAVVTSVKNTASKLKKDDISNSTTATVSFVLTYEPTAFKAMQDAQAIKSLSKFNEMPFMMTTTDNAQYKMSIALDQMLAGGLSDEAGECGEDGDMIGEVSSAAVFSMAALAAQLEEWSSQVEEALGALNNATTIDPFLAEQLMSLFSIFNVFMMVDQFGGMVFDEDQAKLFGNYKSINIVLGDQTRNMTTSGVDKEINALFESLVSLRTKTNTDEKLGAMLQQTVEAMSKVIVDYQSQITF